MVLRVAPRNKAHNKSAPRARVCVCARAMCLVYIQSSTNSLRRQQPKDEAHRSFFAPMAAEREREGEGRRKREGGVSISFTLFVFSCHDDESGKSVKQGAQHAGKYSTFLCP